MKRIIALTLALTLLLCGCGGKKAETPKAEVTLPAPTAAETTQAATEATTEPTTVPTEPPIYRNPLNGEIVDEPFNGRIFASTMCRLTKSSALSGSSISITGVS